MSRASQPGPSAEGAGVVDPVVMKHRMNGTVRGRKGIDWERKMEKKVSHDGRISSGVLRPESRRRKGEEKEII